VPISYNGRTYAEGKKINWKDGVAAFWHIARANMFGPRAPLYHGSQSNQDALEATTARIMSGGQA